MDDNLKYGTDYSDQKQDHFSSAPREDNKLVRTIKSIIVGTEKCEILDDSIINHKYYNSFNYSLLSQGPQALPISLGITSPNQQEGKTLVASNLAVSFAMGSQKKTVLIDLNILNPRLHQIFGTPPAPGLADAFKDGEIHLYQTVIENLFVLPCGNFLWQNDRILQSRSFSYFAAHITKSAPLSLDHLIAFRDVIYSLEQEYDILIVDMPAINSGEVPILFANQMNGLVIVVNSGKTKRDDLDRMFQHINKHQVLGFVLNRFKKD